MNGFYGSQCERSGPSEVASIHEFDWLHKARELDVQGWTVVPRLLSSRACRQITNFYSTEGAFRSQVKMAHHGFGRGEYKYFSYPLPEMVQALRSALYPPLATVANEWHERMRLEKRFPQAHADYLRECHAAGQVNPTPLLLRYGTGDFNCLHQDLYGEEVFPLQVAILLSQPGVDFVGGEFVLTEQRPRMQSRVEVVPLKQGDAVVFAVNNRPMQGTRGVYRVKSRHGVSTLREGHRHTLGIIFHDAK
jgi:uncharacterized protein